MVPAFGIKKFWNIFICSRNIELPHVNAPARIAELERQLHWAQLKIQALREELRQRRIQQLGPKSETLSNLQLELLTEEEPSTTRDEVEAEARRETIDAHAARGSASHIRAASRCRRICRASPK